MKRKLDWSRQTSTAKNCTNHFSRFNNSISFHMMLLECLENELGKKEKKNKQTNSTD